jgi:hypothetical protein
VSSVCVISSYRLNLTVQTLVGSFPGVIVPIPLHTQNIMYTSYISEQKRLLGNQENRDELECKMLDYVNHLHEKYKKNIIKTKLSSRFYSAGLQQMYNSTYNRLCRETHNNINCLIQRHFDHRIELEKLEYLRTKELSEIAHYVYTSIDILHKSLVAVGQFFKFERSKNLSEIIVLQQEFKKEFSEYLEEI